MPIYILNKYIDTTNFYIPNKNTLESKYNYCLFNFEYKIFLVSFLLFINERSWNFFLILLSQECLEIQNVEIIFHSHNENSIFELFVLLNICFSKDFFFSNH